MWYTHCVIASLPPLIVTALSVELGSISLATWIEAPVTSRISRIFDPPFPVWKWNKQNYALHKVDTFYEFGINKIESSILVFEFIINLPISDPHCEAGTINLKVIGGFGTVFGDTRFAKSYKGR